MNIKKILYIFTWLLFLVVTLVGCIRDPNVGKSLAPSKTFDLDLSTAHRISWEEYTIDELFSQRNGSSATIQGTLNCTANHGNGNWDQMDFVLHFAFLDASNTIIHIEKRPIHRNGESCEPRPFKEKFELPSGSSRFAIMYSWYAQAY